jgi:hypothetical protein
VGKRCALPSAAQVYNCFLARTEACMLVFVALFGFMVEKTNWIGLFFVS